MFEISAATSACEEIRKSQKFGKVLELILLIGNILNSGSKNAQSVGFDISYLPKLSNTKDKDNNTTLMDFLVETIETSYPEVLQFYEDFVNLDVATKISCDSVENNIKQLEDSLKVIELEISVVSRLNKDPEDGFKEVMGSFLAGNKLCLYAQNVPKSM